ncbi:MAG TPA: NADH:ubiquinone oxidoreductase, partial [Thermofilum sp.]|nr:NADH:ubiquinone oxidoreductase [Thermofilum sp.]
MSRDSRLKMGIFSLSSCEGCLVQLLNMEELLEVLNNVDLVDCRLLGVKKNYEKLNIAIVEGAVMSDEEERELKEIRERADILIALGDCACNGSKFLVKDFNINEIKL